MCTLGYNTHARSQHKNDIISSAVTHCAPECIPHSEYYTNAHNFLLILRWSGNNATVLSADDDENLQGANTAFVCASVWSTTALNRIMIATS